MRYYKHDDYDRDRQRAWNNAVVFEVGFAQLLDLNKLGSGAFNPKGNYGIYVDMNPRKIFWADNDDEAVKVFKDYFSWKDSVDKAICLWRKGGMYGNEWKEVSEAYADKIERNSTDNVVRILPQYAKEFKALVRKYNDVSMAYNQFRLKYRGEGEKHDSIIKTPKGYANKGKEGTHGTFKTKKLAREQQKAMFANGYRAKDSDYDKMEDNIPSIFKSFVRDIKLHAEVEGNEVEIQSGKNWVRLKRFTGIGDRESMMIEVDYERDVYSISISFENAPTDEEDESYDYHYDSWNKLLDFLCRNRTLDDWVGMPNDTVRWYKI